MKVEKDHQMHSNAVGVNETNNLKKIDEQIRNKISRLR